MKITKEQALDIANEAMENAGYHITQYDGFYVIWEDDNDSENNYAVAINKEADKNGKDKHFAIYVSLSTDESWWEYTENLDVNELADKLMRIANEIEIEEEAKRMARMKKLYLMMNG